MKKTGDRAPAAQKPGAIDKLTPEGRAVFVRLLASLALDAALSEGPASAEDEERTDDRKAG